MTRFHCLRLPLLLLPCLTVVLALAAVPTGEPPRFSFLIAPEKEGIKRTGLLYLRPNTNHVVEVYLKNPDQILWKNAIVKVVDGNGAVLAQADPFDLPGQTEKKVIFPGGKEVPKEAIKEGAKEAVKEGPKSPPLPGPVQDLYLTVAANGKEFKDKLSLRILHPAKYIDAEARYDHEKKKLTVTVSRTADMPARLESCDLKLVPYDPLFTPGLERPAAEMVNQTINNDNAVDLFVDKLQFSSLDRLKEARIFLTVDGYERAFEFLCPFRETGKLDRVRNDEVAIRFQVPRYVVPGPKLDIKLLADGPIDKPMRLELDVDRSVRKDDRQFTKSVVKPGLRDVKFYVEAAKGDLLFRTAVKDWQVSVDTAGVTGKSWLRVRVLDGLTGNVEKPISSDALKPLASAGPAWARLEPDNDRLYAAVIFDKTAPEGLRLINPPKEWARGELLAVKAVADKRDAELAPVDKAYFFFGKKPPDGKLPADAKPGLFDDRTGSWSVELPTDDKAGVVAISVQLVTLTGGTADASAFVHFKEKGQLGAGDKQPLFIKGTVLHGSNVQANLVVYLMDAKLYAKNDKDAQKGQTKTNAKGEFEVRRHPAGQLHAGGEQDHAAPGGADASDGWQAGG